MVCREIKQKANELGFDLVGITSAEPIDAGKIEHFRNWLSAGNNGKMVWLQNNLEKRFNPALLMPGSKSVICTAFNYKPAKFSNIIASYALYQDYHTFIRQKLTGLAEFIKTIDKNLKFKICVDSAPLAEKAFAERAGLGFIGKNCLLTNPQIGSFLLLGELLTNLLLKPDAPLKQKDYCKNCNKCLTACPTGAISKGLPFNANKCISYLTIEHKGRIAKELKPKMNYIFGCDTCIKACPYNEKAPICKNNNFQKSAQKLNLTTKEVLQWSKSDFDAVFADSAVFRTGLRQLKRNALLSKTT
jgi:epoxyqueuosine reductase